MLPSGKKPPQGRPYPRDLPRPGSRWFKDAGWAGVVAESFLNDPGRAVYDHLRPRAGRPAAVRRGDRAPASPDRRWDVGFSTYYTGQSQGLNCPWRGVLRDSPEAQQAQRVPSALILDPRNPPGPAIGGALVEQARDGTAPPQPERTAPEKERGETPSPRTRPTLSGRADREVPEVADRPGDRPYDPPRDRTYEPAEPSPAPRRSGSRSRPTPSVGPTSRPAEKDAKLLYIGVGLAATLMLVMGCVLIVLWRARVENDRHRNVFASLLEQAEHASYPGGEPDALRRLAEIARSPTELAEVDRLKDKQQRVAEKQGQEVDALRVLGAINLDIDGGRIDKARQDFNALDDRSLGQFGGIFQEALTRTKTRLMKAEGALRRKEQDRLAADRKMKQDEDDRREDARKTAFLDLLKTAKAIKPDLFDEYRKARSKVQAAAVTDDERKLAGELPQPSDPGGQSPSTPTIASKSPLLLVRKGLVLRPGRDEQPGHPGEAYREVRSIEILGLPGTGCKPATRSSRRPGNSSAKEFPSPSGSRKSIEAFRGRGCGPDPKADSDQVRAHSPRRGLRRSSSSPIFFPPIPSKGHVVRRGSRSVEVVRPPGQPGWRVRLIASSSPFSDPGKSSDSGLRASPSNQLIRS